MRQFEPCDNDAKPCIRVFGAPGDQYWVIPKDTFETWQQTQAPRRASMAARIEAASSFAFRHWDTKTIEANGSHVPELGQVGASYLIVPKCYDREENGNFRYQMRKEIKLNGGGEKRHTLRCSWD